MNKEALIDQLAECLPLKKSDIRKVVDGTFTQIEHILAKGKEVRIVGFGLFFVRKRAARTGRDPRTGKPMKISATRTPAFRPGKTLQEAVKGASK